jgi:type II secretory pathway pseudopilin PulG
MDNPAVMRSRGFRLVDLCVVVAIVIVIAGVLLPVLQMARAAAARTECQNNLKQIVLAIHDYAGTYNNALPPLSGVPRLGSTDLPTDHPQSIFFGVLPFIEKDIVYSTGMKMEPSGRTWMAILPDTGGPIYSTCFYRAFVCPADSSNSRIEPTAHGWVGSSYAANALVFGNKAREIVDPRSGEILWNALESVYTIGSIPDGTSVTIFVAERFALAGVPGADMPCSWVDPPAGGPALGNKDFDAMGCPLQPFVSRSGAIRASLGGPGIFYGSGTQKNPVGAVEAAGVVWTYPAPEIGVTPARASTDGRAQSQHPTVVQVGMGDGSVRSISKAIGLRIWLKAIDPFDLEPLRSPHW